MLSAATFILFFVIPVCAVAGLVSRLLENAAERLEQSDMLADLTSNAADIAGRLDNLETILQDRGAYEETRS